MITPVSMFYGQLLFQIESYSSKKLSTSPLNSLSSKTLPSVAVVTKPDRII